MAFQVRNRQGSSYTNPNLDIIDSVLAELDGDLDIEHPDVSLKHDSEWTLSAFPNGLLI